MISTHPNTARYQEAIAQTHQQAFGPEKGAEIVALVSALASDETAKPILSLVAQRHNEPVGHILFSKVTIPGHSVEGRILAPLAVLPEHQGQGIGGALIHEGLAKLTRDGVGLVFVLGHTTYYPRFGFKPAAPHGLMAPYPLPPEHQDGWMAQAL
ncbi:MAG: N-acetyltransferase [Planctomycetota bacterium]